jgi:hypothetical protein
LQVPSHYEFQTRNQKPNTQENAGKETGKLDLGLGLNFLCAVIGAFAGNLAVKAMYRQARSIGSLTKRRRRNPPLRRNSTPISANRSRGVREQWHGRQARRAHRAERRRAARIAAHLRGQNSARLRLSSRTADPRKRAIQALQNREAGRRRDAGSETAGRAQADPDAFLTTDRSRTSKIEYLMRHALFPPPPSEGGAERGSPCGSPGEKIACS